MFASQTDTAALRRGIHDFNARLKALKEHNGEHFEMWLKASKRKQRAGKVCNMCNSIHSCSCEGCVYECILKYVDDRPEPIDLSAYVEQCEEDGLDPFDFSDEE